MAAEDRKVKFLTGTPLATELDWTERHLLSAFLPSVRRFLGDEVPKGDTPTGTEPTSTTAASLPRWRSIPLRPEHLPSGLSPVRGEYRQFSQIYALEEPDTVLPIAASETAAVSFATTDLDPEEPEAENETERRDFLEHSFHVHEGEPSSQLDMSFGLTDTEDETSMNSYISTALSSSTQDSGGQSNESNPKGDAAPIPRMNAHLSVLSALPKAKYLQSMYPQAPIVNIVAAVISVMPPRQVVIRRTGRAVDLVELLAGDDTQAGFPISIWLMQSPTAGGAAAEMTKDQGKQREQLRLATEKVRIGDLLLIQNMALAAWRGKVYGQSVRRRAGRSETTIQDLNRMGLSRDKLTSDHLPGSLAERMQKVRVWAERFLIPRPEISENIGWPKQSDNARADLPPDTPA